MKVKYRRCPQCKGKMVLRKSHSKNTKFWGCTTWKDTGCDGSAPYHGDGARAGLDLDVREIANGYIITSSKKYANSPDEESSPERYCKDKDTVRVLLKALIASEIDNIIKQLDSSEEFTDEIDAKKHEKRVRVAKSGTKDVSKLLAKLQKAKASADLYEADA